MNSENINKSTSSDSDEISLKELILKMQEWLTYLLSKWMLILSFSILGVIFGFACTYNKKLQYTASTTFVLEEDKVGGGFGSGLMGLASMAGIDINGGGGLFQGDNILVLYRSRSMIEKTLLTEVPFNGRKIMLVDRYIDINGLREDWSKIDQLKNLKFQNFTELNGDVHTLSRTQDSIIGLIVGDMNKNCLNVTRPDKKLSIIKADIKSSDEFFSKAFNDQIVKNVNDFYIQTKTKKSLENVLILKQKADSVRAIMNGAIYTAAAVSDATPNLNPTRLTQRLAPIQRSQFNAEANKEILGELVKNLELSKIALIKERPLIQVIDRPVLPLPVEGRGRLLFMALSALAFGTLTVVFLITKRYLKKVIE